MSPGGISLWGLRPLAAFRRTPADNPDTSGPFVTDVRLPHHKLLARTCRERSRNTRLIFDPYTVLLPNDVNIYVYFFQFQNIPIERKEKVDFILRSIFLVFIGRDTLQ